MDNLPEKIIQNCCRVLSELNIIYGSSLDFWLYASLKNQLEYVIQLMKHPELSDPTKIKDLLIGYYAIHEIDQDSNLQNTLIKISELVDQYRIKTEGETADDLASSIRKEIWKKKEKEREKYLQEQKQKKNKEKKLTKDQKLDILQYMDPLNKNNAEIIIQTVLEDFFKDMPQKRQKDYLTALEESLNSKSQDFSTVFVFSKPLFGEEFLLNTKKFVQITYETLSKIYQSQVNK